MFDLATYFPRGIIGKQASTCHQQVSPTRIFEQLMDPDHGDRITELRRLAADSATPTDVIAAHKKQLPAVVWQSLIRDGLDRKQANVEAVTGFVPIDIDGKDNPGKDLSQWKAQIAEFPFMEGVWISPTGGGLHAVARVQLSPAVTYQHAAEQVFAIVEGHTGLKVDHCTSSPVQSLFLSFDPEAAIKHESEVQPLLPAPPKVSLKLGPALYQACHGDDHFSDRSSFAARLGGAVAAGELKANDPWIEVALEAICKTSAHPTECRRKLDESIEYGKSTYEPEKRGKRKQEATEAEEITKAFLNDHVLWSTNVYAEKSARPVFRLAEFTPNPRWVEVNEQALLCMMGLDKDPDRAFNCKVLYALSLMAQVKGPECDPAEVNNRLMNLRNGVYDTATGTLTTWTPEMKLLGALPRAYLHAGHPDRVVPAQNQVHTFLTRYGKDVYNRLLYWVFPKIFSPSAGNYIICLVGLPGCGKTTLLEGVCLRCVGAEATLPLEVVEKNSHELTQWEECYWNFFDEMSPDGLRRCEILKRLATQSTLTVNPKGSRIYPVRCVTTPVFGSNVMMWFPESDGAIFDRLIAVFFTVRFRHMSGQIEDLGAYFDTIPEAHWDSFYSDVLDIARENRHTKPPVAQMEAEYKLYRDRFFVFMSSAMRTAPGTRTRLSAIVEMYLEEHKEIRKRAARNHKQIADEKRGSGTLFDLARNYCGVLGLTVERDGHSKCEIVRDVVFSPETSSAPRELQKCVDLPDDLWNSLQALGKTARTIRRKNPMENQQVFEKMRITLALLIYIYREKKERRKRETKMKHIQCDCFPVKNIRKSAGLIRIRAKNPSSINTISACTPADEFSTGEMRVPKLLVAAREIRQPVLRMDSMEDAACVLLDFRTELLRRTQVEGAVHLNSLYRMIDPRYHSLVPQVIDELVESALVIRNGSWLDRVSGACGNDCTVLPSA